MLFFDIVLDSFFSFSLLAVSGFWWWWCNFYKFKNTGFFDIFVMIIWSIFIVVFISISLLCRQVRFLSGGVVNK